MSKTAKRAFWIQTVSVLIVVACVIAGLVYLKTKPFDAESLSIAAGDLRSLSSAGRQLAIRSTAGNLTDAFFRNQIELMHDNIASIRDELDKSEGEPSIHDSLDEVRGLAAKLDTEFGTFATEENSEARSEQLGNLASQLSRIEEELKRGARK
jgi:hypothetical protein